MTAYTVVPQGGGTHLSSQVVISYRYYLVVISYRYYLVKPKWEKRVPQAGRDSVKHGQGDNDDRYNEEYKGQDLCVAHMERYTHAEFSFHLRL